MMCALSRLCPWRAIGFLRLTHYLGREIRGTDWYPDWQLRLFDRRRGRFVGDLVHDSVKVTGPVGTLAGEMTHRPY